MPTAYLERQTELISGQRKVKALSARIEVSSFQGRFDLTRSDIEAKAYVEAVCSRGECPLLSRQKQVWALSGYARGMPRLVLPVLPLELLGVRPAEEGDRWQRIYSVSCLVVGCPSVDDLYGLFPGPLRPGEISLADLAAALSDELGDSSAAVFDAEGGFRWGAELPKR